MKEVSKRPMLVNPSTSNNLGTSMECGKFYLKPNPRKIPMAFLKIYQFFKKLIIKIFSNKWQGPALGARS